MVPRKLAGFYLYLRQLVAAVLSKPSQEGIYIHLQGKKKIHAESPNILKQILAITEKQ